MYRNFLAIILLNLLFIATATACTDFRVIAKDGSVIITRSMEFAQDLQSNLMTSPQGRPINSTTPQGKPGLSWKGKYGYVFLDGLNSGFALDGMNDQGLSFEALYLPGMTQYQDLPIGQEAKGLGYLNLGDWILGNFKTVAEVKAALPGIYVYAQKVPQAPNMVFPLHFAVYESSGKGIIIEYVAGKLNLYDNLIGVMTNSPTYDWQVTNLRNFVNLTPTTPNPIIDNGITFYATGQGAGMHGLPGDISPPSRFVKMAVMNKSIIQPGNALEAVNMAQHVINNVDIPLGFVREAANVEHASNELTQWVVFKDLTHKIFYYRTYNDLTIHAVDMTKLNLAENAAQIKMPIASKQFVMDMTQAMLDSGKKS